MRIMSCRSITVTPPPPSERRPESVDYSDYPKEKSRCQNPYDRAQADLIKLVSERVHRSEARCIRLSRGGQSSEIQTDSVTE